MGNCKKIYTINEDFFSQQTEESCYVAGLLYADGCLCQDRSHYFVLSLIDRDLLEQVSRVMESTYPIKTKIDKRKDYSRLPLHVLQINGKKICKDLNLVWNLHPRKTNSIVFPVLGNNELMSHFIRGYFDGDGCISKIHSQGTRGGWMVHFTCAAPGFAHALLQWLLVRGIKARIEKYKDKECWTVYVYTGYGMIEKFYKLLYTNASIYLERKHAKFVEALASPGYKTKG